MIIKFTDIIWGIYLNLMIEQITLICLTAISLNLENSDVLCRNSNLIVEKSIENKIDPIDFVSILWNETKFTTNLINHKGSCGISQINPKYTKYWNKKNVTNKNSEKNEIKRVCNILLDEKINITIGIEKFSYWYNIYSSKKQDIAFCAYNYGFRCKGEKNNLIPDSVIVYKNNALKFSKRFRKRLKLIKYKKIKVHNYIN